MRGFLSLKKVESQRAQRRFAKSIRNTSNPISFLFNTVRTSSADEKYAPLAATPRIPQMSAARSAEAPGSLNHVNSQRKATPDKHNGFSGGAQCRAKAAKTSSTCVGLDIVVDR